MCFIVPVETPLESL